MTTTKATSDVAQHTPCRYCGRLIIYRNGIWIDPEATGDDSVWRITCEARDTFTAEHEPHTPGSWEEAKACEARIATLLAQRDQLVTALDRLERAYAADAAISPQMSVLSAYQTNGQAHEQAIAALASVKGGK